MFTFKLFYFCFYFCFQSLLYIVRSVMSHCSNLSGTDACVLIYYRHIKYQSPESIGIANKLLFAFDVKQFLWDATM